MKTSLILTPSDATEFTNMQTKLTSFSGDFEWHSIITVAEKHADIDVATISVPDGLDFYKKANIARQLVPEDTEVLLFVKDLELLTKEWIEGRLKAFTVEKIIGIIGQLSHTNSPDALEEKLLNLLNISIEELTKRTKLVNGEFRVVNSRNFSTTVEVWDKVGGLPQSTAPVDEYCIRAQALGYGILPQVN